MIKFFRRIRQKLLSENRFSKYLIYAIGEIVLVVIGILIALQINNWNEKRKASIEGLVLLNNIYDDLKYNLDKIDFVYTWDSTHNQRNKKHVNDCKFLMIEMNVAKPNRRGGNVTKPVCIFEGESFVRSILSIAFHGEGGDQHPNNGHEKPKQNT